MKADFDSLAELFQQTASAHKEKNALWINGEHHTYMQLLGYATQLAQALETLVSHEKSSVSPLIAIFGHRTLESYVSVLGVLMTGCTYVPLNPKFPADRTATTLNTCGARYLVADKKYADQLGSILVSVEHDIDVIYLGTDELPDEAALHGSRSCTQSLLASNSNQAWTSSHSPGGKDAAYLMFTSGSTGVPKGVSISHNNVLSYLKTIRRHFRFNNSDRFIQLFDFTFDLSVHDMFVCWMSGACLYCVPTEQVFLPQKFVQDHQISVWFSVPSVVSLMKKFRALKSGQFPSIRISLFCGEELTGEVVKCWHEAAPNAEIHNLYGPTETTIAIAMAKVDPENLAKQIPIGAIFDDNDFRIVDDALSPVIAGQKGELLLSGPQLSAGYHNNFAENEKRFVQARFEGSNHERWYRTGDLASESAFVKDIDGTDIGSSSERQIFYHGRLDRQIKIRGYRVELQEVESVIRDVAKTAFVAVIARYDQGTMEVSELVAYVCHAATSMEAIKHYCQIHLPSYMCPTKYFELDEIPLNANGKTDHRKLTEGYFDSRDQSLFI